jgi:pyruvate-formate lyase-activating enzyme
MLQFLGSFLDAVNIDLKWFREECYASAHLDGVCSTIYHCVAMGTHIEVSPLVVPEANDSNELRDCADFLAAFDREIGWRILAYHDDNKSRACGRTPVTY